MKFMDKVAGVLEPMATFVSNQRYLLAIRDAFFVIFAPTMAASFLTLLNAMVFNNATINEYINLAALSDISVKVYNGSFALMSIFMALFIAYNLARPLEGEGNNPLGAHAAAISLSSFFVVLPTLTTVTVGETTGEIGGVFAQSLTGSGGMFLAILVALSSYKIFSTLSMNDKIKISMPDEVPPAVAKSFNTLIPGMCTILIFAIFSFGVESIVGLSIPAIVTAVIQKPLTVFVQNPFGMLFIVFVSNLLWVFGIHGASILSPITAPTLQIAIDQNIAAANAGQAIPNIVTQNFIDSMNLMIPVALVISVFIFAKREDMRAIGKLAAAPAVFNISEPVMFGMPVVFNPLLMVPYLIAPMFNLVVAYALTAMGVVSPVFVAVPWTTPPVLNSFLATGGDVPSAIMAAVLLIIDVLIFAPFIITLNKHEA